MLAPCCVLASVLSSGSPRAAGVGTQALQVRTLEPPPTVAKSSRKSPDEMTVIIEDLMSLLDGLSNTYRRGKHPDSRD